MRTCFALWHDHILARLSQSSETLISEFVQGGFLIIILLHCLTEVANRVSSLHCCKGNLSQALSSYLIMSQRLDAP